MIRRAFGRELSNSGLPAALLLSTYCKAEPPSKCHFVCNAPLQRVTGVISDMKTP